MIKKYATRFPEIFVRCCFIFWQVNHSLTIHHYDVFFHHLSKDGKVKQEVSQLRGIMFPFAS